VPATERSLELARAAAAAAADKLAATVIGIDVSEQLALTDVFVITSAESERQVGAIVDAIEDALRELGVKPVRREGRRDDRWVLLDFGDIVAHVQHEDEREFYQLERLWRDCPVVELGVAGGEEPVSSQVVARDSAHEDAAEAIAVEANFDDEAAIELRR